MLSEQNTAKLPGSSGDLELSIDPVNEPGKVKVTLRGESTVIDLDDLFGFVFIAVDEEKQSHLIPVTQTTITKYTKQHRVAVKKHLKPGQEVVVNCVVDIPLMIQEALKGSAKHKVLLR